MPSVIVVGGGVAGLVAARELALGGRQVTLLEAGAVLGGRVARHTVGGIELDAGAESFATRGGTVAAFATELGLGSAIVRPNPAGAWLQPAGRPAVPLPRTGLLGIPGTPLARDVIAVTGLRAALRAEFDALLPAGIGAEETSLGALVRRRMGRGVLEALVAPVASGIHSRHPDELDVDRVAPGLRKALARTGSLARAVLALRAAAPAGSAVAGIDGGIYRLVEALVAELERLSVVVHTEARVTVAAAGIAGGVAASGAVALADGSRLEADEIVLATRLNPVSTGEIVLATLVVDAPGLDAAPRGTGLLVAQGTPGIRAKALTHATAKWPWLAAKAGPHRHVLRLSYNGAPIEGLAEIARADAERLLGVALARESVVGFARVAWPGPNAAPLDTTASQDTAPQDTASQNTTPQSAGVRQIGEGVAGTGLAAGIAYAKRVSASMLAGLPG